MNNPKRMNYDLSKIPEWAKVDAPYQPRKNCKTGRHVPVVMTDEQGNPLEVCCQECAKPMTLTEWEEFFGCKYIPTK